MTEETILLKLKELAEKYSPYSPYSLEEISIESRMGEDLRIIGDDAAEFFEEFSGRFDVDMSPMSFDEYFPSEGSANMNYYLTTLVKNKKENRILRLLRLFESTFWSFFATQKSFKSITLEKLMIVIDRKKWS